MRDLAVTPRISTVLFTPRIPMTVVLRGIVHNRHVSQLGKTRGPRLMKDGIERLQRGAHVESRSSAGSSWSAPFTESDVDVSMCCSDTVMRKRGERGMVEIGCLCTVVDTWRIVGR